MEYSEADLLKLISQADSAGFSYLYKKHFNMVRHLVENNSGRTEDASDLFQDVLMILFEQVRDGREFSCSLKTYIYSVARNQWLKKLRSMKKSASIQNFEDFVSVEEETVTPDVQIGKLLEQIGEACRKLLVLFYYQKKSMEEICVELNYANADTAKNQKYKCIQRLKKLKIRN